MKKFLLLFGFLCLGMVNVNAQDENQVRWIRGCVYDNSGNPIEGAEITFWAVNLIERSYGVSYSASDGVYQIDLPDGGVNLDGEFFLSSHLTCEIEGYVTSEVYNLWKNPVDEYGIMTIDFVLQKEEANGDDVGVVAGDIQGTCVDVDGNLLAGVEVSLTLRALIGENPITVVTNQAGKFGVDLPEGYFGDMIYWVKASVENGDVTLGAIEESIPISEDGITEVNLTLVEVESLDIPEYRNEYLVLDAETGKPIEGATVQEFYRHYQHDNGIQKGEKFVTDEMGCVTTENRISEDFCWHPSYVMVKAHGYGTEKVYLDFVLGGDSQGGLEQVIIYMRGHHVGEDAGLVDGIETVNTGEKAGKHYSVSGVEIAPNAKGLHIVNGKKVLVK